MTHPKGVQGTWCLECDHCAESWIGKKRAITYCKLTHNIVYSRTPGCAQYALRTGRKGVQCRTHEQIRTSGI